MDGIDGRGPLGQNVLQLSIVVLTSYIFVVIVIRGQGFQIRTIGITQRNTDRVNGNASLLHGVRLSLAVPIRIFLRITPEAGSTIGNEHHIGRTSLIQPHIQPFLSLLQRRSIVRAAIRIHFINSRIYVRQLRGKCLRHTDSINLMAFIILHFVGKSDDRHLIVRTVSEDGRSKFLADSLSRVNSDGLSLFTRTMIRTGIPY